MIFEKIFKNPEQEKEVLLAVFLTIFGVFTSVALALVFDACDKEVLEIIPGALIFSFGAMMLLPIKARENRKFGN